jgi:hypothetical protein
MAHPENKVASETRDGQGPAGCLVRLGWFMFGNAGLVACIGIIASHKGNFLSAADLVLCVIVPVMLWLRYVDITRLKGETASGQPATITHWKRYVGLLLAFSVVTWAAAHAIAWLRG